jgi:hypothetical protein
VPVARSASYGCNPRFAAAIFAVLLALLLAPVAGWAGGPKYIAGTSYFDSAVVGTPVHWSGGVVNYYVDRGDLSGTLDHATATAMVDAAAALWSAVATAGVTLTDQGALNENVTGANVQVNSAGYFSSPSDITPSATSYPLAIIYDYDGAVIDAVYGSDASAPGSCQNNSVYVWLDNINTDATIAHAVMILNGRCTATAGQRQMMSYELERAFGRVLGLDYSQVNPTALTNVVVGGTQGWPIMQPMSGVCGNSGGTCIPNPSELRYDDIAALNRIYPITASNLANFSGKELTAANTVSITGTVSFATGYGMQGVNVVARPLDSSGNPLYKYTATAVSGRLFNGNHGSAVTGWDDASGALLTKWGSEDASLQGYFDLSDMPLPPGVTSAGYQISFEEIEAAYIDEAAVGPYTLGQVAPSGTLSSISVTGMTAGSSRSLTVIASEAATNGYTDAIASEYQPRQLPVTGFWCGRLSQVGQTDWLEFPVRGSRTFTIVTVAYNESGAAAEDKALPSIGVWDGFDAPGTAAVGYTPGLNGYAAGETWLRVTASGDDIVRMGIADLRGDGRPDYAYQGWVLYADTVAPTHIPAAGGNITIYGMGFRQVDTVLVNGVAATVLSITPTQITAIAPAAASGATGSVDVEVDDESSYYAAAIITGGLSYDAGSGDTLTLDAAPSGTAPIGAPVPFTVTATTSSGAPASGVTVTYTVTSGSALLACGYSSCAVTAAGDGLATENVTAVSSSSATVTASLANGASVSTTFTGGTAPTIASLTPELYLAAGATFSWTTQALVLSNGSAASGQTVTWQSATSGIALPGTVTATTNSSGIANKTLTVGPLTEGQTATVAACTNGQCATFTAYGAAPETAQLRAVSGTSQSLASSATPSQIVLRVLDANGNEMAGGTVALYQALYAWTAPCAEHAVCAQGALLATQSGTALSAVDGTVIFTPLQLAGVATNLQGLAVSGNAAAVNLAVEAYP